MVCWCSTANNRYSTLIEQALFHCLLSILSMKYYQTPDQYKNPVIKTLSEISILLPDFPFIASKQMGPYFSFSTFNIILIQFYININISLNFLVA